MLVCLVKSPEHGEKDETIINFNVVAHIIALWLF